MQQLTNNIDPLITEYKTNYCDKLKNDIVKKYYYLVKICSSRIKVSGFEKNDLESYGAIGLLDAIDKYDNTKNVKFEYYAKKRIHGSIYDYIRKEGMYSRATINNHKLYTEYIDNFLMEHLRIPTYSELIIAFGIQFLNKIKISNNQTRISLTDELANVIKDNKNIFDNNIDDNNDEIINKILNFLEDKEKIIYLLLYHDDYNIADISELFNLTQASISQHHAFLKKKLKHKVHLWLD